MTFYGAGMGGMYPGMLGMGGVGMGGMGMGGMGMGGIGMYPGAMGMYPSMIGAYGMPRYPPGGMLGMGGYSPYGGGYGNYGMVMDPTLGYGAPPAANFVDDYPDAHRVEHAFRQSAPDAYGVGMGMMGGIGGGMGINNLPGSQMLLYGRGGMGGYGGWYA